MKSDIRTGL